MIDKQEAAVFELKQDFNRNKEKISEYIKYAENWQVISVICSYTAKHQKLWYTNSSSRSDR